MPNFKILCEVFSNPKVNNIVFINSSFKPPKCLAVHSEKSGCHDNGVTSVEEDRISPYTGYPTEEFSAEVSLVDWFYIRSQISLVLHVCFVLK